jgi:TonB-linked SusC/RagA family outer membrane protein
MKLATFLLLICFTTFASTGYSQAEKVSIQLKKASVKELFQSVENQTSYKFLYRNDAIENLQVTLDELDTPLDKILNEALMGSGLSYKILPNNLIVVASKEILQQLKIAGTISDEKGNPIAGVTVLVKGTTNGALSDVSGKYLISNADKNSTLIFSFVGMDTQEIPVAGKMQIDVVLTETAIGLNEVVVIGYGTEKKATLTGSVATVKGVDLVQNSSANVSNSLVGRLQGVIANNRSGQPGNDDSQILIRGFNSFGGGTSPLIVIDGIPDRDMNRLNPDDIESISILKDASAAIYGVRSANGVILITTKRGISGKPSIHYDGSVGLQQLTRMDKREGAWQYMTYYNELGVNQGGTAPYSQADIDLYKAGNDPNYTSTNWINEVFKKIALQTNHSLSVNGGNEQVKYYFSGQYLNQTSNLRNSDEDFKEFNIRSNIDVSVSKNIKVNLDVALRKEDTWHPVSGVGSVLHEAVSMYPFLPAYWTNGFPSAGISNGRNPVLLTSSAPGYDKITSLIANPKLGFDIKLPYVVNGLSLSGYAAFDFNYRSEKVFTKPWDAYSYDKTKDIYNNQKTTTSITSITQDEKLFNQNTFFLKLAFDRQFNQHGINAFVGYEQTSSITKDTYAYRRDLLSDQIDQIFTGSTVNQIATGSTSQDGRESYLGRVSYNYSSKYLADVTVRYNGSFNFAPANRWGLFPAISLGWVISEENFFKNNIKAIDKLKLRASWGLMGNDAIAQYLFLTRYQLVTNPVDYAFFGPGYTTAIGLYLSASPNINITWEKQDSKNIGFDASLLSNRLNVSFDMFRFLRRDILAQRNASVPLYTGLSLPAENIGKSLNRGIDFSVNYSESRSELKYNIGANFTYAKSKIIFRDESPNIPDWQKSTGYAIDSWLVYKTNGIYHTQAEIDNSAHMSGVMPGDLWIKDTDGNNSITSNDMVRIPESATPKIVYGITMGSEFKGIALDLLWVGQGMAKQMILSQMQGSVVNPPTWLYDGRWTADNPINSVYPRAFNSSDPRNSVYADFWLRDASFLRLKSAELSYTLPVDIFAKYGISKVRVYVSGSNLFSLDKMKKYNIDPETNNITGVNYPQTRIYRFGLNIEL